MRNYSPLQARFTHIMLLKYIVKILFERNWKVQKRTKVCEEIAIDLHERVASKLRQILNKTAESWQKQRRQNKHTKVHREQMGQCRQRVGKDSKQQKAKNKSQPKRGGKEPNRQNKREKSAQQTQEMVGEKTTPTNKQIQVTRGIQFLMLLKTSGASRITNAPINGSTGSTPKNKRTNQQHSSCANDARAICHTTSEDSYCYYSASASGRVSVVPLELCFRRKNTRKKPELDGEKPEPPNLILILIS